MPKFVYTDRSQGPVTGTVYGPTGRPFQAHEGVAVFACEAADILSADTLLMAATGIVAMKRVDLCYEVF